MEGSIDDVVEVALMVEDISGIGLDDGPCPGGITVVVVPVVVDVDDDVEVVLVVVEDEVVVLGVVVVITPQTPNMHF